MKIDDEICPYCDKIKPLIPHHISYEPEQIIGICEECHRKIKKQKLSSRGFPITKIYPTTKQAYIPLTARRELGNIIELIEGVELVVMVKYQMTLADIEKSLKIVLEDIKFRRKLEEDKK